MILDATLEAGNTEEEDTAASALLLKHEFLDGGVAELAGNQNVVAVVEDGSGLVPHEILVLRLGGPWQQEGFRLALRLLRLALLARLARLPLQVQVNGLARRLRLHGRSVRGGFAAIQPLHQAMLQVGSLHPRAPGRP